MTEADQNTLLEIYKLHADLADRVSQRREGANRLFVSMHTALVVFLATLYVSALEKHQETWCLVESEG